MDDKSAFSQPSIKLESMMTYRKAIRDIATFLVLGARHIHKFSFLFKNYVKNGWSYIQPFFY
ncbi:hypothetical protein [Radiobacillus sp. PE A8.2]|uniref:hypothetical protein n=1 Tax=Radiobacillus sp. PE A8.2 TaxID=3380349 RepID=UPI003890D708